MGWENSDVRRGLIDRTGFYRRNKPDYQESELTLGGKKHIFKECKRHR